VVLALRFDARGAERRLAIVTQGAFPDAIVLAVENVRRACVSGVRASFRAWWNGQHVTRKAASTHDADELGAFAPAAALARVVTEPSTRFDAVFLRPVDA